MDEAHTEDLVGAASPGGGDSASAFAAIGLVDTAVPVSPGGSAGRLLDLRRSRGRTVSCWMRGRMAVVCGKGSISRLMLHKF